MDCITSTQSFASLPATLATLRASWLFAPLERLGLRCLPPPDAERMLRRCTSVALKKATMKGCLFCGPLRPISPATRGLMLSPAGGDTEKSTTRAPYRILHFIHAGRCIKRKGMLLKSNKCTSTCCACVYFARAPPSLSWLVSFRSILHIFLCEFLPQFCVPCQPLNAKKKRSTEHQRLSHLCSWECHLSVFVRAHACALRVFI